MLQKVNLKFVILSFRPLQAYEVFCTKSSISSNLEVAKFRTSFFEIEADQNCAPLTGGQVREIRHGAQSH